MIAHMREVGLDPHPDVWVLIHEKALEKYLGPMVFAAFKRYRDEIEPCMRKLLDDP